MNQAIREFFIGVIMVAICIIIVLIGLDCQDAFFAASKANSQKTSEFFKSAALFLGFYVTILNPTLSYWERKIRNLFNINE